MTRSGRWICGMRTLNRCSFSMGAAVWGRWSWSPDGKSLAFASRRDDHGFVGVYSFADQSLKYLDPSTEIDREPVWSPDSRAIAFVRIPPDTSGVDFKPRRSAQPWSIVWRMWRRVMAAWFGMRMRGQAACFMRRSRRSSCSGARETTLFFRGREMGGCIFIRWRRAEAMRPN